ncbi:MAG: GAF domain-containing protein [Polyangia bacterium]
MYWEVTVPADDGGSTAPVTVEANNWFSALRNALNKKGLDGRLISNLSCDIKPDRSVQVTDFVTRKVFMLRPLDGSAPAEEKKADPAPAPQPRRAEPEPEPQPEPQPELEPEPQPEPAAAPAVDLVPHEVFFTRDEVPDDGSSIFYRERLLEVNPSVTPEEAGRLAVAVFRRLRDLGHTPGTKLFVSVQVFDHRFVDRSQRPAIAALTWKQWSQKRSKLQFPLSGQESFKVSRLPASMDVGSAGDAATEKIEQPLPLTTQVAEPQSAAPSAQPQPQAQPQPRPAPVVQPQAQPREQPRPAPLPLTRPSVKPVAEPEPPAAEPDEKPVLERKEAQRGPARQAAEEKEHRSPLKDSMIAEAFERMQEIYSIRDHDEVAKFALRLGREFIDCEAGSSMLITPGKYELYVAAAEGEVADQLRGQKLSLTSGIVGFATRAGAVLTVSDPASDPRFHENFDQMSGFHTRNVVCAPIQHEGRTLGAIELVNSPREDGFLQSEANVLSYIAGAVGEYVEISLPSREADFSDKEFAEFVPIKDRKPALGSKAPAAQPSQQKRSSGKVSQERRTSTPSGSKKKPSQSGKSPAKKGTSGGSKKKRKKKRKR